MNQWVSKIAEHYVGRQAEGLRDACITAKRYSTVEAEYQCVRNGVGLVDYSYYAKFKLVGDGALDTINRMTFGDVSRVPINQTLATFVLKPDGTILCDVFVANVGDGYLVLSEGVEPMQLHALLEEQAEAVQGTSVTDLTRNYALFGLEGPYSWELLKQFMGMGIIGMRYLEIQPGNQNQLDGIHFDLLRSGKSGEYGYILQVDADKAVELWNKLCAMGAAFHISPVGYETMDLCRLENRFINIHFEGLRARNALEVNIRVMAGRDKGDYAGSNEIETALRDGVRRRFIGLIVDGGNEQRADKPLLALGDQIVNQGETIGEIANAGFSYGLGKWIAGAFLDAEYAYVGLDYQANTTLGPQAVRTVSAPFITNRSLRIRPQEDSYFNPG